MTTQAIVESSKKMLKSPRSVSERSSCLDLRKSPTELRFDDNTDDSAEITVGVGQDFVVPFGNGSKTYRIDKRLPLYRRGNSTKEEYELDDCLTNMVNLGEITQSLKILTWNLWGKLRNLCANDDKYSLKVPHACPGSSNNIMYIWEIGDHYLECEIFDSGEIEFFYRNSTTRETWGEDIVFDQILSVDILQKVKIFVENKSDASGRHTRS
jgi:hypothetical protein